MGEIGSRFIGINGKNGIVKLDLLKFKYRLYKLKVVENKMYNIELLDDQMTDKYISNVRESFSKDYLHLGINEYNAPTNGAFFNKGQLNRLKLKGALIYVIIDEDNIAGGVGCIIEGESLKINRLFVSVDYQGKGLGKELLDYCINIATGQRLKKVVLGMIRENKKLYNYYLRYGFSETKTTFNKKMGFNITFMEKRL